MCHQSIFTQVGRQIGKHGILLDQWNSTPHPLSPPAQRAGRSSGKERWSCAEARKAESDKPPPRTGAKPPKSDAASAEDIRAKALKGEEDQGFRTKSRVVLTYDAKAKGSRAGSMS